MTQEEFNDALENVQYKIGYNFKNLNLLIQAFTRNSFSKENPNFQDNEVLEFYGDSALNNFVTRHLYEKYSFINDKQFYSQKDEGELSKIRANNIEKENLAHCIEILGFENYLLMGKGDIKNNVQESISVKEDLFEAIVGAVAVDSNWSFEKIAEVCTSMLVMSNFDDDYIALVEEWCKKHNARCGFNFPHYTGGAVITLEKYYDNSSFEKSFFYPHFAQVANTGMLKLPKNTERQNIKLYIRFSNNELQEFEGTENSLLGAKMSAAKNTYEYLELLDMREVVGEITFDNSIQKLQELYQNKNKYIGEPVYKFEEYYDDNGNPIWKCVCKVYEKETENVSSSKKTAKKGASYKMLCEILEYDVIEENDNYFEEEEDE